MTVSQSGTVSYSIIAGGGGSLDATDQAAVDNLAANTSAMVVALSAADADLLSRTVALSAAVVALSANVAQHINLIAAVSAQTVSLSAHDAIHDAQIAVLSAQAAAIGAADTIVVKTQFASTTLSSVANTEVGTLNRAFVDLLDASTTRVETNYGLAVGAAGQALELQYTVDTDQSAASVWSALGPRLDCSGLAINTGAISALVSVPATAKITAGTWVRLYVSGGVSASNQFKNTSISIVIPARGPAGSDGSAGTDGADGNVFSMSAILDITGNVVNQRFAIGTDTTVRLDNMYLEAISGQARFGFLRGVTSVFDNSTPVNHWTLNNESTAFVLNSGTPQKLDPWGPLAIRVTNSSALGGIAIGFVGYPM